MSGWLKSILGYILIVSISVQMLPNQKYEQYLRLFTGFLLMILMFQPVLKICSADRYLEKIFVRMVEEQEELDQEIGEKTAVFRQKSDDLNRNQETVIRVPEVQRVEVLADD